MFSQGGRLYSLGMLITYVFVALATESMYLYFALFLIAMPINETILNCNVIGDIYKTALSSLIFGAIILFNIIWLNFYLGCVVEIEEPE